MTDNALLEDMTVADMHFVPQRALLNSLGEQRLERLALLLELYGGAIRFSTNETDEKLVAARLAEIRGYLCEAGVDTTEEAVALGQAGGRGLDAGQVLLIKANEGSYVPKKKSSSAPDAAMTGPRTSR
jgi:hypothetical protein